MRDEVEPYLWSDADIYRYMDSAQKDFCALTGGIGDSRSGVTSLNLVDGVEYYTLSPRVLKIRSAYRVSDGTAVDVFNIENMEDAGIAFSTATGAIEILVTGLDQNYVRAVPIPNSAEQVKLVVYRLPLTDITSTGSGELEIQEQHHVHLVDGIAMYAYRKRDAETFDPTKSSEFEAVFRRYCDQAKAERERREHRPREVVYRGL
jgi:hypothetical protein